MKSYSIVNTNDKKIRLQRTPRCARIHLAATQTAPSGLEAQAADAQFSDIISDIAIKPDPNARNAQGDSMDKHMDEGIFTAGDASAVLSELTMRPSSYGDIRRRLDEVEGSENRPMETLRLIEALAEGG